VHQQGAVAVDLDFRAVQHGGLVAARGQARQAGCRRAQAAIGVAAPVGRQPQAFVIGQHEQAPGRRRAVDFDDPTAQPRQPRQGGRVEAEHAVDAAFGCGQHGELQHQGLMPRCRATMPPVML